MSTWRLAKALDTLLLQVNTMFPTRSKDSDGTIGDTAHSERKSDHNPVNGIVHALDITHDPAHGFNSHAFADFILAQQDARLSYVISNRRIGSGRGGQSPGQWRYYGGANPHDHHVHISVIDGAAADDTRQWTIGFGLINTNQSAFKSPPATVRIGSSGDIVKRMQSELMCTITGHYEARSDTEYALRLYQVRNGLDPDGVCGAQTWKILWPEGFKLPK